VAIDDWQTRLAQWLPVLLSDGIAGPQVHWHYAKGVELEAPFFHQTAYWLRQRPYNLLFEQITALDHLEPLLSTLTEVVPSGFIFHLSRCGSTLAANLLRVPATHLVYAEPPLLDQLLRRLPTAAEVTPAQLHWLRLLLAALASFGRGRKQRMFIKLDAWDIVDGPLLRAVAPQTPALFLYRDPLEILVSHRRSPGMHALRGALDLSKLGLPLEQVLNIPEQEYLATVLALICREACHQAELGQLRLINYDEWLQAPIEQLEHSFQLHFSQEERRAMVGRLKLDAKSPTLPFQADGANKRQAADPALIALAERLLYPWYERLEALRSRQRAEAVTLDRSRDSVPPAPTGGAPAPCR